MRDAGFDVEEFRDAGSLGEAVYDALVEIIERDFAHTPTPTELERERASHEAFAASRRHAYIPNPSYLTYLNTWHDNVEAPPLIIYAESGSGKSSLVSFWCQQLRRRDPEAFIVEHYVGIGAGALDHYGIMRHVMSEIKERFARTEEIPSKPEELAIQFANWLGFTVGAPMLLVVDGINQLSGRALELHWLPPVMPPGVKLIITSTVEQTLVDLRRRGWRELAMQPLSEREREGVVVRYLSEYHKALAKEQVAQLAADAKCSQPLFLRTLLEELRIDSAHEKLDERIALYLGTSGTEDLFQKVLKRMEDDYSTQAVREVMSHIWCSRSGMNEEDLQALTGTSRLNLSTMLGGLDYHLVRKEGVLTFFHDYLRRAVGKRYLADERQRTEMWRRLAVHFESAAVTLRATRELLYALDGLGDRERMHGVLAEIERFEQLWEADRFEVWAAWAGCERELLTGVYRSGLELWERRTLPGTERCAAMLGQLATFQEGVGNWDDAEQLHLRRLNLLRDLADRPGESRALAALSNLALRLGRSEEAADRAREAEATARELGDRECIRRSVAVRGNVHRLRGEYAEALECYRAAEAVARELGDRQGIGAAVNSRGNVHCDRGEYAEALECHREQEAIAREMGDRKGIGVAVGNRSNVHRNRGEYAEALECLREQEAIMRELGDRKGIESAVGGRGIVHSLRGEYAEALECYREQEAIARDLGDRQSIGRAVGNRGNVHLTRREYAEALECLRGQEAISRELGDRVGIGVTVGNRGLVHYYRGEHDEALECFREKEAIARETGERTGIGWALGARGMVHAHRGEYAEALECYRQSEAIARELGDRQRVGEAVSNRGLVHVHRGEHAKALECFREHEAISRELGDRRNVGEALGNRGSVHASRGDYAEALECFRPAAAEDRTIGYRYGLCRWLDGTARVLVELVEGGDEMPEFLPAFIEGADTPQWRVMALRQARGHARECLAIAQELAKPHLLFSGRTTLARIEAAGGRLEPALELLRGMLDGAQDDGERAECNYWLWKLALDPTTDHRAESERLYAELFSRISRHDYKEKLEELRAASSTAASTTEVPDAIF